MSAPSTRARSVAASRSKARRDPTASLTHFTGRPASSRRATVCITHTCASQPATTSVSRPAGNCSRNPGSDTAEKKNLANVVSQSVRTAATFGPSPSGFSSVPMTGNAQLARRRRELDAAPDDAVAVVDRRHQALLRVDDQQGRAVGLAQRHGSSLRCRKSGRAILRCAGS
jgi:hypothetical protein